MADEEALGRVLRDRTRLTQWLVLRAYHERPRATLREIATDLDVTVQAVSAYVKDLVQARLLEARAGGHAVTPAGFADVQHGLAAVKRAADAAYATFTGVDVTSALAEATFAAGDAVGLHMVDGDLVARPADSGASGSRGRAVAPARPGEEVIVTALTGVVDLRPGRLTVVRVPAPHEGGSARVPTKRFLALLAREHLTAARVGVAGTGAKALARRAGLDVAFSFASVDAAFNAAELGLDVALLTTRDVLKDALSRLDNLNGQTLVRVPVRIVDAPVDQAEPPAPSAAKAPGRGAAPADQTRKRASRKRGRP